MNVTNKGCFSHGYWTSVEVDSAENSGKHQANSLKQLEDEGTYK